MIELRCVRCGEQKGADDFHKDRSRASGRSTRCKPCARAHLAEIKARNGDKMKAARRERHKERMKTDPEYAERVRRQNRENRRKQRAAFPERNAASVRESYYRKRNDPEAWARFLAKKREYWARIREENRALYEAMLEARRINRRLRRIDAGLPVRKSKMPPPKTEIVNVEPIAIIVERCGLTPSELAKRAGVDDKSIRNIIDRQPNISLDLADKVCIALGFPFSLVYDEGEE